MIKTGCGKGKHFVPCDDCIYELDPLECHEHRKRSGEKLCRSEDRYGGDTE